MEWPIRYWVVKFNFLVQQSRVKPSIVLPWTGPNKLHSHLISVHWNCISTYTYFDKTMSILYLLDEINHVQVLDSQSRNVSDEFFQSPCTAIHLLCFFFPLCSSTAIHVLGTHFWELNALHVFVLMGTFVSNFESDFHFLLNLVIVCNYFANFHYTFFWKLSRWWIKRLSKTLDELWNFLLFSGTTFSVLFPWLPYCCAIENRWHAPKNSINNISIIISSSQLKKPN